MDNPAILALEDGRIFKGKSFGASGERFGEVVFNTSMAGYQEILTDPSYKGQIVTMTYPLIGNYGVNKEDVESFKPFVEGFVVKEYSKIASNWRSQTTLGEYLKENDILGIEGIDTRALTLHIRRAGAMKAVLSTIDLDENSLIEKARNSSGLEGIDLVKEVTCKKKYILLRQTLSVLGSRGLSAEALAKADSRSKINKVGCKIAVLDCGVKYNILRELLKYGCQVNV
ncbi:MAG: carbamoyl phosphate synthase small subunit, partial [Candidatus Omnitrophota bacterium]